MICRRPVDVEWLRANRDQLFAEALHRLGEGESWWDVPRDEQVRLAMEHHVSDPWEEIIEQALAGPQIHNGRFDSPLPATLPDPQAMTRDPPRVVLC